MFCDKVNNTPQTFPSLSYHAKCHTTNYTPQQELEKQIQERWSWSVSSQSWWWICCVCHFEWTWRHHMNKFAHAQTLKCAKTFNCNTATIKFHNYNQCHFNHEKEMIFYILFPVIRSVVWINVWDIDALESRHYCK